MFALALIVAALLGGVQQSAQQTSIAGGKIVDAASGLPVPGARIIAMRLDGKYWRNRNMASLFETEPSAGEQDPKADPVAVLSGEDGRFHLSFAGSPVVVLLVDAAGYVKPQLAVGEADTTFALNPDSPKTDLLFRLVRASALSGRIIDADTEEPLKDFRVSLDRPAPPVSVPAPMVLVDAATSGKDGRFSMDRIAPGDYVLRVSPPSAEKIDTPKPVVDFRNAVLRGYAPAWYPGVDRREEAVPLHVPPGGAMEGIEIGLSKRRIASLRGHVVGDEVADGGGAHLEVHQFNRSILGSWNRIVTQGEVKLGSEFEIANLAPGTYILHAWASGGQGVATVEVGEENQEGLDLRLTQGVVLKGRVRIAGREDNAEKPALPTDDAQVQYNMLGQIGVAPVAGKDGRFVMEGVTPWRYHIRVLFPPDGYAVSEVRYNGARAVNGFVHVNGGAHVQELSIELSRANAGISAYVTDGDQPAADATLLLAPSGVTEEVLRYDPTVLRWVAVGKNGRTIISDLLPGGYRVTAYPKTSSWMVDPNLLRRLTSGEAVELGSNQTASITVRAQPAAGAR